MNMHRVDLSRGLIFRTVFIVCWVFITLQIAEAASVDLNLYVATNGKDTWSGRSPVANKTKTDGPLATLIRARDLIREIRKTGKSQSGKMIVNIRGGIYRITDSLELMSEDSGTKKNPVIWRAQSGESVRLVGGVKLTKWKAVSDSRILDRLDPVARKNVLQIDMKSAGAVDLGTPTPVSGWRAELIFNNKYMTLARYPNVGSWEHIASIPQGGTLYNTESDSHYGRWAYNGDRPSHWKDISNLWVHGYWVHDWADEYQHVAKLDIQKNEFWPELPYHGYGYRKGQRFYFLNIIEELDSPGEWFLDRVSSTLYFWPPSKIEKADVLFPEMKKPVITLAETQHIYIQNIVFECTRNQAIVMTNGTGNKIAGCVFRNIGGEIAVSINGYDNEIRSCDIYEIAGTGVKIDGGDRKTLTPGRNCAVNNDIYNAGQVYRTYHGAFILDGVGQRIANCYIHDLPHQGIGYGGNDHVIEYCDFTRIAQETGDVGVMYAAMDWTYLGHEFRYNYFHNIHGPGNFGCNVIYPDLPCGGINLHHNIFYDVDKIFHTNSGRGMVIENNLFIKNNSGISFGGRGYESMFKEGGAWRMVENLKAVNYDQPPYVTRYPILRQLAKDFGKDDSEMIQRQLPKDNIVRRNISWGNMFLSVDPLANLDQVKMENNVIADDIVFTGSITGDGTSQNYRNGDEITAKELGKRGNIFIKGDPGFGDMRTQDFNLSSNVLAKKIGFKPIPFRKIGLLIDEYRKQIPLQVSEPIIQPASSTFLHKMTFRLLLTPLTGPLKAVIRYTLDGSEPTSKSHIYTNPVEIAKNTSVNAAAFVTGNHRIIRSKTVTAKYRFIDLSSGSSCLSDLPEQDLFCYTSCWKKDSNHLNMPIKLNGIEYLKGILLHPDQAKDGKYGRVTYELTGELRKAKRFSAVVGIEDEMAIYNLGSAAFIVEAHRNGQWNRVCETQVIKFGDKSKAISVDISGADKIRLTTTDGGDGIACDHAVWANPILK